VLFFTPLFIVDPKFSSKGFPQYPVAMSHIVLPHHSSLKHPPRHSSFVVSHPTFLLPLPYRKGVPLPPPSIFSFFTNPGTRPLFTHVFPCPPPLLRCFSYFCLRRAAQVSSLVTVDFFPSPAGTIVSVFCFPFSWEDVSCPSVCFAKYAV